MTRAPLRWWLWTAFTFAILAVAGMRGFYGLLLETDITYLGLTIVGLYIATTARIGYGLVRGTKPGRFAWHMVGVLERMGLLGTFAAIAIVLYSVAQVDPSSPEFKTAVVHAVMTKLFASICGLVSWIFLSTQLTILELEE